MQTLIRGLVIAGFAAGSVMLNVPAFAQDAGFYVGGSVGQSKTKDDTSDFTALGAVVSSSDNSDTGYRVFGGYQITKNLGVEIAYVDLGQFSVSGTIGAAPFSATVDGTGYSVSAVGTLPLNDKFSLFGSVGAFQSKVKVSATVAAARATGKDNETDVTFGIGAKYNITRNLAARLEANHYEFGDNGDAQLYSIGLQYKF